jgi:hypothetical protein
LCYNRIWRKEVWRPPIPLQHTHTHTEKKKLCHIRTQKKRDEKDLEARRTERRCKENKNMSVISSTTDVR